MLFTSIPFLFAFLPAVILCYYFQKWITGNRLKNVTLLAFSYVFYLFGTAEFLLLLIFSTIADYVLGLLIHYRRRQARAWVTCSLGLNIGLLAYYKYADFFTTEFSRALSTPEMQPVQWPSVILPIGISFFTFQKISYVIDVYRRNANPTTNPIDFSLYVAMFPQLVAGPIVRFKDIWLQMRMRTESFERFYSGALRFCWGLAKKVLIADACGEIADMAFGLSPDLLDTRTAWLGALAYTLQIYYDFSGYSDMAIGLAALFGFRLHENFNRPYAAISISDFWRRWHISLSKWFRDYLYFPLGGSRQGNFRTYLNLTIVFLLCGLWHGANWTFIVWGLYHGFFLILERTSGLKQLHDQQWRLTRRCVTLLIVIFGWILFRSPSIEAALGYWQAMVIPAEIPWSFDHYEVLHRRNLTFLAMGVIGLIGAGRLPKASELLTDNPAIRLTMGLILLGLALPYCAAFIIDGAGHPFIYFRF
jgi:alginate O-acetyltransferase complex protein AlgI